MQAFKFSPGNSLQLLHALLENKESMMEKSTELDQAKFKVRAPNSAVNHQARI
jgi:hypothetical protein